MEEIKIKNGTPTYNTILDENGTVIDYQNVKIAGFACSWSENNNLNQLLPIEQSVIDHFLASGSALLIDHKTGESKCHIGKVDIMVNTPEGLYIECSISNSPEVRHERFLICEGIKNKFSIHCFGKVVDSFVNENEDTIEVMHISMITEISLVDIPGDSKSQVIVQSLSGIKQCDRRSLVGDKQTEKKSVTQEQAEVDKSDDTETFDQDINEAEQTEPEKLVCDAGEPDSISCENMEVNSATITSDCVDDKKNEEIISEIAGDEKTDDKKDEEGISETAEKAEIKQKEVKIMNEEIKNTELESLKAEVAELKQAFKTPVQPEAKKSEESEIVQALKEGVFGGKRGQILKQSATYLDGASTYGSELKKNAYFDELVSSLEVISPVVGAMKILPVPAGVGSVNVGQFTTDVTADAGTTGLHAPISTAPQTGNTAVVLKPFYTNVHITLDMISTTPNIVENVVKESNKAIAKALNLAVISGDTSSVHMDGAASWVGNVTKQFVGLRKVGTPLGRSLATGGTNLANINTLIGDLGEYAQGENRGEVMVLVNSMATLEADLLAKYQVPGLLNMAQVFNGIKGVFYNSAIPSTLDTDGYYDDVTSGSVQNKNCVIALNPKEFGLAIGQRTVQILETPGGLTVTVVVMAGFAPLFTNAGGRQAISVGRNF